MQTLALNSGGKAAVPLMRPGGPRTPAVPVCTAMPRRGVARQASKTPRTSPPPAEFPSGRTASPGKEPLSSPPSASSDSAVAQITGQVSGWWQAYTRRLESDPVKTKAVTSFLGFMIGDFLAQRIGGEPFSPLRCLRLGAYGLFLDGPIGHQWYKVLDRLVLPDKPRSNAAVLIKTAADQLVWAPIMTVVFFAVLKSLEGHPELIWETVQDKLVKTVVANYILWPGAHFINFKFVPTEHRILYNNCVSVVWNAYLSTLSHAPELEIDPSKLAEQVQETATAAANLLPAELSPRIELPPFERLLPEGAGSPNWLVNANPFGPIVLPPFERLLPTGTGFTELLSKTDLLKIPQKIQLAPTRAVYPLWMHYLPWM